MADDERVRVLRQLMASYDNAAFTLEGAFDSRLEEKAATARRAAQAAADAVFLLLEAMEKFDGTSLPH
jgi:dihydrodipicolinate synthase/N-acetylneuraminate lyase